MNAASLLVAAGRRLWRALIGGHCRGLRAGWDKPMFSGVSSPRLDYIGYLLVGSFLDRPWFMETVRARLRHGRAESWTGRAISTRIDSRDTIAVADSADGDHSDWRSGS